MSPTSAVADGVSVNILDVRISGLRAEHNYYLVIRSHDSVVQSRDNKSLSPWWPETFSFSLPERPSLEFQLFYRKRVGSTVFVGHYTTDLQSFLSMINEHSNEIGPLDLCAPRLTRQAPPPGAIIFKLTRDARGDKSVAIRQSMTRPPEHQMKEALTKVQTPASVPAVIATPPVPLTEPKSEKRNIAGFLLRAKGALDRFVAVAVAVSEIHPVAQAAIRVIVLAYNAWRYQEVRDEKVGGLAKMIAELWEFMTQDKSLDGIKTVKSTVNSMLRQTSECATFIQHYTADSNQVLRFVKNCFSNVDSVIGVFERSFTKLRHDFLAGIDIAVVTTVLDMQQTMNKLAADASRGALSYGQALQHSFKAILAPPAPVIFHGRDDDVRRIVRTILGDDQSRVPILGTAGIGKTTIALAVINNSEIVQKFGDRRYFVPCDEVTKPLLLAELLATHLGIALKSVDPMQDILAALRTHASPCIVVLDNFETPWDPHATQSKVESILAGLSGVPNLSLIITMRGTSTPMGVKWSHIPLEVSPLSLDAARSTFRDNCPIEDEALDDLLIALDFVPLAVTLMAAVGKSSKLAPSDLLKSWQKEQTSLLDLGPSDRLKSVDYSIRLSLQGAAMTSKPEALQMLSVLAMLPRGASPESLLEMVPSIVRLDAAIRVLIKVSLVYKDTTGVLRLLSPIRSYISHHHPPDDHLLREVRAFYYRLAQSCSCGPGDEDFLSVREKVLPEETNIDAILSGSLLQTPDRDCVIAVINYSQFLIFNHPRTETLALATSVARRAPFPNLLGRCLQRFGEVLYAQSRFDEARVKMEEARQQFQKGGQRLNAAICLRSLGDILRRQSQLDLAWDTLQEARRQFDGVGDRLGSAFCLRSLSNIRRLQSRYDEARKMLSEARVQFQALGHGLGAARCLRSLGDILVMQNQFDEAATVLENGHSRFKAIGHELGAARCRQTLGEVLRKQRRFSEAQKVLEEVLEQFKEGGDRLGTARCLRGLGDIHRMECRYDQAFATLDEARQQFDEIGNRLGHAQCLWRLGVIFYMQQRYEAARIYTEDARKQFLQIGNRHGVAQSLQSLGDIFRMQGSLAESHTALEESLDHFQDIGDQIGISQCLQSLSIIDHSIS